MTTHLVRTICLGLIGLAAGCDGITPPATLPAPLDTDLRQSIARWGVVPIGPMPASIAWGYYSCWTAGTSSASMRAARIW